MKLTLHANPGIVEAFGEARSQHGVVSARSIVARDGDVWRQSNSYIGYDGVPRGDTSSIKFRTQADAIDYCYATVMGNLKAAQKTRIHDNE